MIEEAVLSDLERELAAPIRRMAHEDRSSEQRLDLLVANSYLLKAVPDLVAEVRRLRAALEQVWWLADAEEPSSVRAGDVAREALGR